MAQWTFEDEAPSTQWAFESPTPAEQLASAGPAIAASARRDAARAQATPFQRAMQKPTDWLASAMGRTSASMGEAGMTGTEIVGAPATERPFTPAEVGQMTELSRPLAKAIIPQNEVQALAMLFTGGAGGLAAKVGLKGLPAVLTRIFGGTTGGAIGGALSEEGAVRGGVQGAAAATIGEGIGAGVSKGARLLRGKSIAHADAAKLGAEIERQVPELAGARTPAQLQELGYGAEGTRNLRRPFEALQRTHGEREVLIPALSEEPMLFSAALEEIAKLGPKGYSGTNASIITRTARGMDARALREQAVDELRTNLADPVLFPQGLGEPGALTAYDAARKTYRTGKTMLGALREPGAFTGSPTDIRVNLDKIGEYLSKNRAVMREKLGADQFKELSDLLLRGGEIGTKDLSAAPGIQQFLRSFTKTKYAGKQPFTLSPTQQTTLDVLAERRPKETAQGGILGAYGAALAAAGIPRTTILYLLNRL